MASQPPRPPQPPLPPQGNGAAPPIQGFAPPVRFTAPFPPAIAETSALSAGSAHPPSVMSFIPQPYGAAPAAPLAYGSYGQMAPPVPSFVPTPHMQFVPPPMPMPFQQSVYGSPLVQPVPATPLMHQHHHNQLQQQPMHSTGAFLAPTREFHDDVDMDARKKKKKKKKRESYEGVALVENDDDHLEPRYHKYSTRTQRTGERKSYAVDALSDVLDEDEEERTTEAAIEESVRSAAAATAAATASSSSTTATFAPASSASGTVTENGADGSSALDPGLNSEVVDDELAGLDRYTVVSKIGRVFSHMRGKAVRARAVEVDLMSDDEEEEEEKAKSETKSETETETKSKTGIKSETETKPNEEEGEGVAKMEDIEGSEETNKDEEDGGEADSEEEEEEDVVIDWCPVDPYVRGYLVNRLLRLHETDNSLPDTDTMYLIQWEGASHLHDSWRSYAELKELGVTGMRKLDNYIKSVRERVQWRTEVATPEEIDMQDIQTAMQFELMMSQSKLERVIRAEVIDPKLFALREQAFACAEEEEQRREERRQERLAMGRGNADDDDFDDDEGEVTTTGVRRVVAVDDDSLLAPTGEIKESALNDYGSFVYLCKWQGIPYAEATWEYGPHIARSENKRHVLEYISRVRSRTKPDADCQALMRRPTFRPLQIQPQWLGNFVEAPKEGQEASATSTLTAAQSVAVSAFDSLMADGSDREMQTLRDYQLDGINWLTLNWCSGRGAILADEMGLGKTVQTVGFISTLMWQYAVYGPFLVVVPLSTISAWAREFHKWAPAINVITYIGDSASRERIRETEWYSDMRHRQIKFNVLLTTYETTLADAVYLSEIRSKRGWACMCLDEAHRLKNAEGRTHQVLTEIKCNHRMLITGTPLQNTLKELWSLLHFLAPARYAEWEEFEQEHNDLKARDDVSRLHTELQPYLLRRVKKDVEKSMPSKTERILRIEMSVEQRRYYKAILTRNYRALKEASTGKGRPMASLVNIVMELKKCCNHPYLVDGRMRTGEVTDADLMLDAVVNASGKMVLLDKLLVRLHEQGHRVLVFSQMVRMLDILAEYLHKRGWPFQRLDGGVGNEARRQAVDHFNKEGSSDFLFLLSTRAGGLGINLATADTVIIFDSDWNPQNDLQAAARAHRIGQKRTVNIYRLVTKSSVEEEILQRAKNKMVLDHLVIQRMDTSGRTVLGDSFAQKSGGMHGKGAADAAAAGKQPFNTEELDAILKFGAMDLFKQDDGDGEGETNFAASRMELDLDEVLSRAEIGGGEGEQGEEGEEGDSELLSQFHVSSVSFKDANVNWDEIIPDSARDRLKAEEADEAARNELRRKRIMGEREDFDGVEKSKSRRSKGKKGALAKGGDAQKMNEDEEEEEEDEEGGEEAEGVDESEDYVGQITGAGARKARRKRISAIAMSDVLAISESVHDRPRKNVDEDLVNHPTESGFAPKDIRKFVARWRQFGDIANQLERIVLSAEMFECDLPSDDDDEINFAKSTRVVTLEKDGQSAKILAQELKNGCEWAVEEAIQAKKEAEAKGASPEDIPDPSRVRFMLNGVGMFAEEMILRDEDMRQLRVRMRSCEGGFFSIPKEVRQQMPAPKKWAFHWSSEDDAALLIGVDMYGFGGWDQVKADEDLGIARRILNKNKLKAPQRAHLGSRVEKLFKLLRQEKGWRLGEEKGGPPGATVSAMSAVGAGRSGSGTVRPLETTTKLVAHEFAYEGRKKEKRKREEVEGEEEKGEEGEEGAKKVKTERAEEEDVHDEKVVEPPVAPGATGVVVATASAPVAPVPVVKEKAKESAVEDPTAAAERALMMQFGWT